jgi:hypothetical protein
MVIQVTTDREYSKVPSPGVERNVSARDTQAGICVHARCWSQMEKRSTNHATPDLMLLNWKFLRWSNKQETDTYT